MAATTFVFPSLPIPSSACRFPAYHVRLSVRNIPGDLYGKARISLTSARWCSRERFNVHCLYKHGDDSPLGSTYEQPSLAISGGGGGLLGLEGDKSEVGDFAERPQRFKNRHLNFVRLGSLVNNAAEKFFKSEIRRRLFVTAVLILVSCTGYFIPLPGFDRRLIPEDYLSFATRSMDELGDFSAELKL